MKPIIDMLEEYVVAAEEYTQYCTDSKHLTYEQKVAIRYRFISAEINLKKITASDINEYKRKR